jgi:aspartyl-tRNA(Asn)/glutamyl-tRNA(Gln) amidotransferase subunit A
MALLRIAGKTVVLARWLAETPLVGLLLEQARGDYGLNRLRELGPSNRHHLDVTPRPIQARRPRQFGVGQLPTPACALETAGTLRAAYEGGRATPRDVLENLIARIGQGHWGNATYSPFCDLAFEQARAAADAATKRWRAGSPQGLLDGIPVSVKDEQHISTLPTRAGTKYMSAPAASDAFVVDHMRKAGAVIFGKTKMTEWGMSAVGYNPHFDMPRNVHSNAHGAGGSSTGAAVALALGCGPIATAGDGGGSIRIPAALSGVWGLKPTYGRVGRTGDVTGDISVFHLGPLAVSAQDIAEWMAVCGAAEDPDDDCAIWVPERARFAQACLDAVGRGVAGARIGVLHKEIAEAPAEIGTLVGAALRELERAGAKLIDVDIPLAEHAPALGLLAIGSEAMANLIDDIDAHRAQVSDDLRISMALLRALGAEEVLMAARYRATLRRQAARVLQEVDLLALPSTACLARSYPLAETGVEISDAEGTKLLTRFAFFGNLTGLPAASVPCGMANRAQGDLAVGLQLIGDAWDEPSVIAAMAQCGRSDISRMPRAAGWMSLLRSSA